MARYIDIDKITYYKVREASLVDDLTLRELTVINRVLRNLPPEDVKPIIYAEWEVLGEKDNLKRCRCSNCKEYQCNTPKFCSGCGAEMKGIKYV